MTTDEVLYRTTGGAAWLVLNRPEKLNALSGAMLEALQSRLEEAAADPAVRAVFLTGTGKGFCVGQDLAERTVDPGEDPPDLGTSLEERYNPIVRLMRSMPKPVVVAVNGVAAGAGANLALAGDIVIAARSATFLQAFARIGLIPDSGGTYFLPRKVGAARAAGLAMLAEPLSAETAAEWGLIWSVVDDSRLAATTARITRSLAAGPTQAYAAIKRALAVSGSHDLDTQLDLERDLQRSLGRSADYREGVKAFFEKRTTEFEGR